jgi:hypothetical protein
MAQSAPAPIHSPQTQVIQLNHLLQVRAIVYMAIRGARKLTGENLKLFGPSFQFKVRLFYKMYTIHALYKDGRV